MRTALSEAETHQPQGKCVLDNKNHREKSKRFEPDR